MTPKTRPPRGRTNDPEGLRRRVLDTAAALFQAQGYAGTAMHDISRGAGVTGGGMHHHFPTKKSVAVAVIRERVREAVEETWVAPLRRAPTVRDGVAGVFRAIEDGLEGAGRVQGCPLNNLTLELSAVDPDLRAELEEIFAMWSATLAARIEADQREGRLTNMSAQALATLIVAAYSGAMAMAKVQQRSTPLAVCARELDAHLLG